MTAQLFGIGIPTLNRYDLLAPTLEKYVLDFPGIDIHVVDNGRQNITPLPGVTVHVMTENIGVAASWNFLCKKIFERNKVAIILNDDIYWGAQRGEVMENIIHWLFLKENVGLAACPGTFCLFAISKKTFFSVPGINEAGEKFTGFDETFFPAYFEDNDFVRRMDLANIKWCHTASMNPQVYRNSATLQKDPTINQKFMKNQEYYIRKWGGLPGKEKFLTPFGR